MDRGDLDRLLQLLSELDGSDLHIKAGAAPRIRVNGYLRTLEDEPQVHRRGDGGSGRADHPSEYASDLRRQARGGLRLQRPRASADSG